MNSPHRPLYSDWRLLIDTPLLLDWSTERNIFLMDSLSDMLANTDWNTKGAENMNQWGSNGTGTPATSEGSSKRRCCCNSKALKTVSRELCHYHLKQAMLRKCYVSSNFWGRHETKVTVSVKGFNVVWEFGEVLHSFRVRFTCSLALLGAFESITKSISDRKPATFMAKCKLL